MILIFHYFVSYQSIGIYWNGINFLNVQFWCQFNYAKTINDYLADEWSAPQSIVIWTNVSSYAQINQYLSVSHGYIYYISDFVQGPTPLTAWGYGCAHIHTPCSVKQYATSLYKSPINIPFALYTQTLSMSCEYYVKEHLECLASKIGPWWDFSTNYMFLFDVFTYVYAF